VDGEREDVIGGGGHWRPPDTAPVLDLLLVMAADTQIGLDPTGMTTGLGPDPWPDAPPAAGQIVTAATGAPATGTRVRSTAPDVPSAP